LCLPQVPLLQPEWDILLLLLLLLLLLPEMKWLWPLHRMALLESSVAAGLLPVEVGGVLEA